jgi:hypothetical protein
VDVRGWDFPHIETGEATNRGLNWVGAQVDWDHYLEVWRFYKSGQFVHIGAINSDWRPRPQYAPAYYRDDTLALWTGYTISKFTEIFELAARLAFSPAGDRQMHIGVRIAGLRDRVLYIEDPRRSGLDRAYAAAIDEFPYVVPVGRDELVANRREMAITATTRVFEIFGWDPIVQFLRDQQAQLRLPD